MGYQNNNNNDSNKYNHAPYNFVPFSEKILVPYDSIEKLPKHNRYEKDTLSGEISYSVEALTPIMVSEKSEQGKEEQFHEDAKGKKAIPGSTMRGLIRSNMMILGAAAVGDDIQQDYRFMYRDIQNKYYQKILGTKQQEKMNIITEVQAGYITFDGKNYCIYGNVEDKFYTVGERTVLKKSRKGFQDFEDKFQNRMAKKSDEKSGRQTLKFVANRDYKPYMEQNICYQVDDSGKVNALVYAANANKLSGNKRNGSVLSGGFMRGPNDGKHNDKQAFYVIPELDETNKIDISDEDIRSFKRDYQMREKLVKNKEFYSLPEKGKTKPVFYIRDQKNNRLYFGFSPRLRLFYDKTVGEGIPEEHKKFHLDYIKSLFGYTDGSDNSAYKSRLSFSDAGVIKQMGGEQTYYMINGEPKPTSYRDYVDNNGINEKEGKFGYNQDFKLRGIKGYWLHNKAQESPQSENNKIGTSFKPLGTGTVFEGKIRFSNLSEIELGLLLWSIQLENNSEQNIGKGKAYGYGRCEVSVTAISKFAKEKAYDLSTFELNPMENILPQKEILIQTTKDALGTEQFESVKNFLLMKNKEKIMPESRIGYMQIKNSERRNEYQQRKKDRVSLPSIQQVLENKPGKRDASPGGNSGYQRGNNYQGSSKQYRSKKDDVPENTSMGMALKGFDFSNLPKE